MIKYLVFVGAIIDLIGTGFYIKSMLKGKTRPNRVTWLMWSVSPLIAAFAALSAGAALAAVPILVTGFASLLVFIISLLKKEAYWKINEFDWICGALSVLALILWYITKDPIIAIVFSILSDFFAMLPTLIKSWKHPETESTSVYLASLLSSLTSFAAVKTLNFASVGFPSYLIITNIIIIFFIKRRYWIKRENK